MGSLTTWSELLANRLTLVDLTHELRPSTDAETVVQYLEGKTEFIAVHKVDGYGDATEDTPHLLKKETAGNDFSVYRVPPYLISVPAVTHMVRGEKLDNIRSIYRAIGRLIYEAANTMTVQPPMFTVSDLAVDSRSGKLFFIPPLHFNVVGTSQKAYELWMNTSIARTFGHSLAQRTIQNLQAEVTSGASIEHRDT